MKNELVNLLVKEDINNFKTFYLDIEDYSFEKINEDNIKSLLEIKNKDIRFEAIQSITELMSFNEYIPFIINCFRNTESRIVADYLHFISMDKYLIQNKLKYFTLLDIVSKLNNEDKADYISNIFLNKNVIHLSEREYINLLYYYISLDNDELFLLVNEVCINNKSLILKMKY